MMPPEGLDDLDAHDDGRIAEQRLQQLDAISVFMDSQNADRCTPHIFAWISERIHHELPLRRTRRDAHDLESQRSAGAGLFALREKSRRDQIWIHGRERPHRGPSHRF
jgi:hypothetical protein